uniref:Protein phosphatase CheZ n=1 Tax=Steinernema glaseri TaxID=37863 RepID=A0A1I7Y9W3_9BILA
MNPSSVEASPAKLEDMLERSLDVLERSQAILERSLAMESTLSKLVEGQEELRRMVMVIMNGSDVPEMTPALREMIPAAFVKREEGDEVDNIELS